MIMRMAQSTTYNPITYATDNTLINKITTTYNPITYATDNTYTDSSYSLNEKIQELTDWIKDLEGRKFEYIELCCKNCGAKIQQKYSDQILKCPYCKTVYAIGTKQINS